MQIPYRYSFCLLDGQSPIRRTNMIHQPFNTTECLKVSTSEMFFLSQVADMFFSESSSKGALDGLHLRNPKLALARLPDDCRPASRMCFFTRDRSEERCRVDIDQWGRIFCPEPHGGTRDNKSDENQLDVKSIQHDKWFKKRPIMGLNGIVKCS